MKDTDTISVPMKVQTWEINQYVTDYMEGDINDWPANIQDQIYAALERLSHQVELPVTIVASWCDIDYGEAMDRSEDRPFVKVVASEVVAADDRLYGDKQAMIEQAVKEIMDGKTVQ